MKDTLALCDQLNAELDAAMGPLSPEQRSQVWAHLVGGLMHAVCASAPVECARSAIAAAVEYARGAA